MKTSNFLAAALGLLGVAFLSGCATGPLAKYQATAYKPKNPKAVRVKVSTSTQYIYVMEGDRCLMAVQGCVGAHGTTPMGNHTIFSKLKEKRSGSFGFSRSGAPADAHKGQSVVSSRRPTVFTRASSGRNPAPTAASACTRKPPHGFMRWCKSARP